MPSHVLVQHIFLRMSRGTTSSRVGAPERKAAQHEESFGGRDRQRDTQYDGLKALD